MATRDDRFPSPWLKAEDVDEKGKNKFVIKNLETVIVGQDQEEKTALYFSQEEKGLLLNVTNWDTIARMYGENDDHWAGNPIELHTEMVSAFGKTGPAIRVTYIEPKKGKK